MKVIFVFLRYAKDLGIYVMYGADNKADYGISKIFR